MAYTDIRTPEAHAATLGEATLDPQTDAIEYSVGHVAASQMHGWEAHKRATTEAFTLQEGYYQAAIVAALAGDAPYTNALSPYAISGTVPPIGPGKHLVESDALQPWVVFEDLELPATAAQVFDYVVKAYGYLEGTPTTRVTETASVRVTRDGSGNASLLSLAAPFSDSRLRVTVGTDDITVDVQAHASQDWVWDTEAIRQVGSSLLATVNGSPVAVSSVASRGAAVSSGTLNLDGTSLGTDAAPTTLAGGSGTATLSTYSPAVSTQTELVAQLRINAGLGGKCIGAISAIVTRGASGAPTVTQSISGNWLNTYAAFNPQFVVSGNNILLQVTAHATNSTFVRGSLSVDVTDISADVDPLDELYADTLAILAAHGGFLFNASNVTEGGGRITAFTDQAGNYTMTRRVGDNGGIVSTLGGVAVMDMEATGETARYQVARTAGASTAQQWSLFVLWAPESSPDAILLNCDSSPVRSLCTNYVASLGSVGPCIAGSGATYTSAATDATPQILEYVFAASTKYVLRDGTLTGTAAGYTPANLGSNFEWNHDTTKLDGKLGDMILVEAALSAGERATIMSYLQTKYAAVL